MRTATSVANDLADPLLPPWQAAIIVGLSPSTLAKRRMDGTGPVYVRLSATRVAYRRSALDAWLATRERTSTGVEAR
jgi:predicted DNA-binding transcriptional regulator AlpA